MRDRRNPRARRVGVTGSVVLVALLFSLGGTTGCQKEAPPPREVVRPIKMMEVRPPGAGTTREYPGRIKAGQYSELSFEVPGRITKFVYGEGAEVKDGAILAQLDPADYQARYDSAVAKEAHARSERDRFKAMYEKDVKPYSEYELKLRLWEVRVAETREAKKALDDTVLRAPFDGVMARKLVELHENVMAKWPVLVFQNDNLLEIKVNVPERDLARRGMRQESAADTTARLHPRVVISSLPGEEFPARLKELANVADPVTRTFEATLTFEKPKDLNVLGGMTAKVVIDVPEDRGGDLVLVPAAAVIAGDGQEGAVWVIDPETMQAQRRDVRVGEVDGADIAILDGLEPGELIALSGVHHLRDGMTVRRLEM